MFGRWSRSRNVPRDPRYSRPAFDAEPAVSTPEAKVRPPEEIAGSVENLERAVASVMEFAADKQIPASVVVNPLLVLWDAAHEVDPLVSVPVEALLTVAVHRSTLGSDEVIGCIQEVRALAIQEAVLAELVGG